jgi:hypothetical protein
MRAISMLIVVLVLIHAWVPNTPSIIESITVILAKQAAK